LGPDRPDTSGKAETVPAREGVGSVTIMLAATARKTAALTHYPVMTGAGPLRAVEVGEGAPVLLLHGWGSAPEQYAPLLCRLAGQGRRAVALTLPGFADSAAPRTATIHGVLEMLLEAVVEMGMGEQAIDVVGHSLGGLLAARMAQVLPVAPRTLVLVNAAGGGAQPLLRSVRALLRAAGELDARQTASVGAAVSETTVRAVLSHPRWAARAAMLALRGDAQYVVDHLRARDVRVWVVVSDADRLIRPGTLAADLRYLRRVGGHHGWPVTHAEECATLLDELLSLPTPTIPAPRDALD
jgi:pimeloyl-ACP methyl ester carboxylesterase